MRQIENFCRRGVNHARDFMSIFGITGAKFEHSKKIDFYRGFPGYFENFLVCNYGPSANVWKQPVYDIANSTCNCPCIGCNPSTGLCPPNCKFAVWADWASW